MTTSISIKSTVNIASMSEGRSHAAVASIDDDSFVVIGGHGTERLSSCEVYNERTNEWRPLPKNMPKGRSYCAAARIGRYIYVVGSSLSMAAYSLDNEEWVFKSPTKIRRYGCAAVASNGHLYVFGGRHCEIHNTAEVYDPETDKWKDLPRMSQARKSCAAVTVGDKIYVIGGRASDLLSSVEIFNVTTRKWEKGTDMPTPRYAHAAVAIGKFIIVIGGCDNSDQSVSSTIIYDTNDKNWSDGPSLATERSYHIAVTINEKRVVIAGGETNSWKDDDNSDSAEMITFKLNDTRR